MPRAGGGTSSLGGEERSEKLVTAHAVFSQVRLDAALCERASAQTTWVSNRTQSLRGSQSIGSQSIGRERREVGSRHV